MALQKEKRTLSFNICFTATFAALCCVCTFIAVPLPFGYFNLGDVFVLLSAWLLGPVLGPLAAGVGTALADVLIGLCGLCARHSDNKGARCVRCVLGIQIDEAAVQKGRT